MAMAAQRNTVNLISLNWHKSYPEIELDPKVDWDALRRYALVRRQLHESSSTTCRLLPQYTKGGVHLVRLLEFDDGTRWLARIQLNNGPSEASRGFIAEVDTMMLIRERSPVPVPKVFGYESTCLNPVGVPFSLIEFIPGDTAMDAFGGYDVHHGAIPVQYKSKLFLQIASIQSNSASIRFPKIGQIIRRNDDSYTVGAFADLGGPFSIAVEYFEAWAKHVKFPTSDNELEGLPPDLATELRSSIEEFPARVANMAKHLPLREGPFPIYHPDFRHSNFIIDKDYNILSIIDWENASSVPWEVVEFPLFLSATPAPMDAPWNYDEFGRPIDPSTAELWEGRDEYVLRVREAEVINGLDQRLSNVLADRTSQDLAGALKLYVDPGKIGFYCRVLDSMVAASSTTKGDQDNLDGAPPTNAGGISF